MQPFSDIPVLLLRQFVDSKIVVFGQHDKARRLKIVVPRRRAVRLGFWRAHAPDDALRRHLAHHQPVGLVALVRDPARERFYVRIEQEVASRHEVDDHVVRRRIGRPRGDDRPNIGRHGVVRLPVDVRLRVGVRLRGRVRVHAVYSPVHRSAVLAADRRPRATRDVRLDVDRHYARLARKLVLDRHRALEFVLRRLHARRRDDRHGKRRKRGGKREGGDSKSGRCDVVE